MSLTRRSSLRRTGGPARTGRLPARRTRPRRKEHPIQAGGIIPATGPVVLDPPDLVRLSDEAWRAEVERRAAGSCQARLHRDCPGRGEHAHHRLRRRHPDAWTVENGVWLCRYCHDHIHFRVVDWARRHLWLLSPGHPFDPPVRCPLDCTADHRRHALEATA